MLINMTNYPNAYLEPEERDCFGMLDEDNDAGAPLSVDETFDVINGKLFIAVWPDDELPW